MPTATSGTPVSDQAVRSTPVAIRRIVGRSTIVAANSSIRACQVICGSSLAVANEGAVGDDHEGIVRSPASGRLAGAGGPCGAPSFRTSPDARGGPTGAGSRARVHHRHDDALPAAR